jgi:hypothetical protein
LTLADFLVAFTRFTFGKGNEKMLLDRPVGR